MPLSSLGSDGPGPARVLTGEPDAAFGSLDTAARVCCGSDRIDLLPGANPATWPCRRAGA